MSILYLNLRQAVTMYKVQNYMYLPPRRPWNTIAFSKSKNVATSSAAVIPSLLLTFMILAHITNVGGTTFNYTSFGSTPVNINLQGDSSFSSEGIYLTRNRRGEPKNYSVGRALYAEPIHLWDSATGKVADFSTQFSFKITPNEEDDYSFGADGLTFFLAPDGSHIPPDSEGGCFGLISNCWKSNSSSEPVVAVEFDTFGNSFDPFPNTESNSRDDHIGIDINSINSTATLAYDFLYPNITYVWVVYNSSTQYLSVYLSYERNLFSSENRNMLRVTIDLKTILPQWVNVGFSAASGAASQLHTLLSWEFSAEFPPAETIDNRTKLPPSTPERKSPPISSAIGGKEDKNSSPLVVSLIIGISLFAGSLLCLILFIRWKKRSRMKVEKDYESRTGPKRFPYDALVRATNGFAADGKLGQGGFGGVYRGLLQDTEEEVAVKRISQNSTQGKKEFISEVKIISTLRHRNLVQLLGWCEERGELLLVYEFMKNGSLDFHLFGGRSMLSWVLRFKIATGLASGLLYLHEGWDQAVVHRDIKSSNIMLDSNFNAKLGDFGLARFADHDMEVKTTMLAGTMGYMAPECVITGKTGKESDVYSFGVVALEIACGRRVVETNNELDSFGLVGWVWELYGSERLLEAVDAKLGMDYNEEQLERLLVVGLWCSNMDNKQRPSIKQAINVLNFEAPLPDLPSKMIVPTHYRPSMQDLEISYTSSSTHILARDSDITDIKML